MASPYFHSQHGPNIFLKNGNTEAVWQLKHSGGMLFTEETLEPGQHVTISCHGSGRVRVGCSTDDPDLYKPTAPDSIDDINDFEAMNEIRFHRRDCSVSVYVNKSGNKITSSCGFLKYDKVLERKQPVWIVMYILFGDVKITVTTLDGHKNRFSKVYGTNVEMNEDRTEARAIHQSPGSFCLLGAPVLPGENVYIACQPIKDDDHQVSNFNVKLFIADQGPESITSSNFSLTNLCATKPDVTVLDTFKKLDCHGEIRVSMFKDNRLEYRSATNKVHSQPLWSERIGGIWLYIELYRVHVKLFSKSRADRVRMHRGLSTRSDPYYQYSHVTFGTRSKTIHGIKQSSSFVDSGEYIDMGHRSSSCPANLDRADMDVDCDDFDEVDGFDRSLDDSGATEMLLYHRTDVGTCPGQCGRANSVKNASAHVEVKHGDDIKLAELRQAIRKNWTELIESLQTEAFSDQLYENGVISHMELNKLRCLLKNDVTDANREILSILTRKGIEKDLLIKILVKIGDTHLQRLFFK